MCMNVDFVAESHGTCRGRAAGESVRCVMTAVAASEASGAAISRSRSFAAQADGSRSQERDTYYT